MQVSYLDPAALAHAASTAWLACVDHAVLQGDTALVDNGPLNDIRTR